MTNLEYEVPFVGEFNSIEACEEYLEFLLDEYGDEAKKLIAEKLYLYDQTLKALISE